MQQVYLPPYRMISVRQPWADLLVPDEQIIEAIRRLNPELAGQLPKDVENRSCGTKFRGTLFFQATQALDLLAISRFGLEGMEFVRGAVVGVARLNDVVTNSRSFWAQRDLNHWLPLYPLRLANPVRCTGFQGGAGGTPPLPVLASVLAQLEHQLQTVAG